ncbi:pseudouridylate synthase 7 homolog [Macrobrachium rosenbergii]|uniref:pseudouridylate synthase 7 homolog n=1 Tax=Macrobrachium rosenbergii TaxID=79674 RepID=UPI0034D430F9
MLICRHACSRFFIGLNRREPESTISFWLREGICRTYKLVSWQRCPHIKMDSVHMQEDGKEDSNVDMKGDEKITQEGGEVLHEEEIASEKKPVKPSNSAESEIGIDEYLGKHPGFFGIIKQRYSDFIVNEVSNSGEIVHLTDRNIPSPPEVSAGELPDELPPELSPAVIQQLDELVGIPHPARIPLTQPPKKSELSNDVTDTDPPKEQDKTTVKKGLNEVLINVNGVSKEGRTNIHRAVKAKYASVVSCYKESDDGNKYIVIQKKKAADGSIPKRSSWPKSLMYTTFVMYKENIDTLDAINHLARRTGVKPNMFAYAGTKDRRGKTSQLVSVPRVAPERLCQAANHRSIHLGNFKFRPTPQKLGQLKGNRFQIVLRHSEGDKTTDVIISSVESLKTNGFINYFGSQRNWEKAIDLILAPRENDNFILNKCRIVWKKTHNAEEALLVLKGNKESSIEGRLLAGLRDQKKNDFVGALGSIPRNVRVLYLHAYQSYIWNKVVSRRVAKYGLSVLPGDIVRAQDSGIRTEDPVEQDEEDEDNDGDTNDAEKAKSGIDMSNFHILSDEEAKTTRITDVLLPLPGHRIEFPQNEVKDWYIELLEADGLSISDLRHRVKCYSVIGSYRRLIVQPSEVNSMIAYYDDPTKPLLQSDMDKLLSESVDENLLKEGKNKAVVIDMTLPASSYATMAMRELLKMDTSSAFQATLNTVNQSSESNAESRTMLEGSYFGHKSHSGRKDENKQHSKPKFHHGQKKHKFSGRGRGEKRPWKGSHGKGGKRGKFSGNFNS